MANIVLKDITFPGLPNVYEVPEVDNTLTQSGEAADAKKTGDEITALKQEFNQLPNGNYPNMTVGSAEQLLSTVFVEDEIPYNFRTSGGSADIGDREYDEIVGVSMPINQVCNFPDVSNTSTTDTRTTLQFIIMTRRPTSTNFLVKNIANVGLFEAVIAITENHTGFDFKHNGSTNDIWFGRNDTYPLVGGHKYFASVYFAKIDPTTIEGLSAKNMMFMDLTQMLGTAIADYVYGLETATAGSGISWLKHHFPKIFDSGYIPYNAGEIVSVEGLSEHKMTGFNQWDEVAEVGGLNISNGAETGSGDRIRSKNYIRVVPNTVYCISAPVGSGAVCFYDANKTFISADDSLVFTNNATVTTPTNCAYIRFMTYSSYGNVYHHDICISLHWDGERDGEYEEYKEYVYPLDDSVVLRGKLELDSDNKLRANGDRHMADGTVERRWRETNMADLTWNYDPSSYRWQTTTLSSVIVNYPSRSANLVSDKWVADTTAANGDNGKMFTGSGYVFCYSTDSVNKPTGTLLFELATPTTETAEPYTSPQIVDDWGTEEYVSTSLVPVGHDTKYANNLRAKLEMSPASPEENGDYIVRHSNGENEYVALGSTTTIQGILDRLTALENA